MKTLFFLIVLTVLGSALPGVWATEPAHPQNKDDSELRVGMLICEGLLHPDDKDAAAQDVHRPHMLKSAADWPKQFPTKVGQRTVKLEVVEVGKEPPRLSGYHLVVLMPCWAYTSEATAAMDAHAKAFHEYIRQGGGLLVFQPNPMENYPNDAVARDFAARGLKDIGFSAPRLLPLPATFYNWYVNENVRRTSARHPITEGLQDSQMPFPADQIVDLSKEYTVLSRGEKSDSPSLAAANFGQGRVVLITCNIDGEQVSPQERKSDVVARSILWAAGCSDKEVMAVGGR